MRDAGATVVHCPIVSARGGRALESFARCRAMGLRVGLGTDTWPPDLVANMQAGLMLCRVAAGRPDRRNAPRISMMRRRWPGRTRWAGRTSAA